MIKPGDILTCHKSVKEHGLVEGDTYVALKYDEENELVRLFCRGGGVWHKKEIFEKCFYTSYFESLNQMFSEANKSKTTIRRDKKGKFV